MAQQNQKDVAPQQASEIPESVAATGSTNELEGREIVEAEVGGEGVADVVATKKEDEEGEAREAA